MSALASGMAFLFDSFAVLALFAAAIGAWILAAETRAFARVNIRFAAILLAAPAVACALSLARAELRALAPVVATLSASLSVTALSLSLFGLLARPLPPLAQGAALALGLSAGLAAALSDVPFYGLLCPVVGVTLTLAVGVSVFPSRPILATRALLASFSLLCGGFAVMDGAETLALLFFAAGLLGAARASQDGVEGRGWRRRLIGVKALA